MKSDFGFALCRLGLENSSGFGNLENSSGLGNLENSCNLIIFLNHLTWYCTTVVIYCCRYM